MSTKASFWDHPIEKIEEVLSLKRQITALQSRLGLLFQGKPSSTGKRAGQTSARKKSAAAQKTTRSRNASATKAGASKATPKGKKVGKRKLSPETRALLSAAAKARWGTRRAK